MKLIAVVLSSLALMAAAYPGSLEARACPPTPAGCTALGNCEFCCNSVPTGCHLDGPPYKTCNGSQGVVVHCEIH